MSFALMSGCVPSDVSDPVTARGPVRPLHVIAAPADHGVFLSWPDHPEATNYTVRWRASDDNAWSERSIGDANHAFIPELPFGTEHEFVVSGHAGVHLALVDSLRATPRDRPDCSYVDYLAIQSFFCSQQAADEAMRAKGVTVDQLRCRNKPVVNWGPDAPDCLYTSSTHHFLLLRNADKIFTESAVPPTVEETRQSLRNAIWKNGDPFTRGTRVNVIPVLTPQIGNVTHMQTARTFLFDDGGARKSRVTHFTPKQPVAGRYAIFHEGHGEPGTMIGVPMIEFLLDRGWEVYSMDMPIHGRNKVDRSVSDTSHFDWWQQDDGRTSPVATFMLPVKYLVDYITATRPPSNNLMLMGRSGGGFTSYVYSALDPRITVAVSVAGGRPISQRLDAPWGALELGDLEQWAPELFSGIRHEDLMVAAGARGSMMLFNTFDNCCFRVSSGDPLLGYLEAGGARTGRVVRGFADPVNPTHGLGVAGFAELDRFLNEVTR